MYAQHNAAVARLVRRQTRARRTSSSARAKQALEAGDDGRGAALLLYKAQLGSSEEQAAA